MAAALVALTASPLPAQTYVVNSTADSGNGTLRQAILNANAGGGGDITFSNVTGVIALATNLPVITASVNILGPGTNLLTVSGSGAHMIFGINAGTTNVFSNFTIANSFAEGYSYQKGMGFAIANLPGSAISNLGTLTVTGCVITNCINLADQDGEDYVDGGAVFNTGTLVMQNSLFIQCGSGSDVYESGVVGGCVYSTGYLAMTNCCLTNCRASEAIGIYSGGTTVLNNCILADLNEDDKEGNGGAIVGGNVTLISCLITNCEAGWEGGAFLGNNLTASNTLFFACGAGFEGGAFYIGGSNLFLNCTIASCGSGDYGGGAMENFGTTVFVNSTLNDNLDDYGYGGGAIYNHGGIYMTNCTLSGNIADYPNETNYGGGAILNLSGATVYLVDCTVVSNSAGAGPGGGIWNQPGGYVYAEDTIIADNSSNDFTGILTSESYNLIKSTNGSSITGDTTGNIYNVDPLLGPLQNNGGFTMTHALLPGSPCINAGPSNAPPYFDQRGVSRPQGPADDIGAYEFGSVPAPTLVALAPSGDGCFPVTFDGLPGFTYTLQRATSPAGPWTPLNSATANAQGSVGCVDPQPPAGNAFYRAVCPFH